MIEKADFNQLSNLEKDEISNAVKGDLVDNLFKSVIPANVVAFFGSAVVFVFLYQTRYSIYLIAWLVMFNITLVAIGILDHFYRNDKNKYTVQKWKLAYSILVAIFTILWGATIYFLPEPLFQRFLLYVMLFMVAASFSFATVGSPLLCILCECFVLLPLVVMFFLQNSIYYKIGGVFILTYILYLFGMNLKSTEWLKNSLKLSRILLSVSHNATHDSLTDLKNQRGLIKDIESYIDEASKTQESFALVCFSINRLERFNTSLGYQAGDLIIQSLAKRLESRLAKLDTPKGKIKRVLTQPRSDSFVILISSVDNLDLAQEAKDFLQVLTVPFHLGKLEATLTASVGICLYPKHGANSKELLCNVYAAMIQAKNIGGNQIEFYEKKINEKLPSLLDLENDLHHALERNELVIYYQPFIDLHTLKIAGMEALIRWQHPKRGLLFPVSFISLAEETRLIIPIGKWVLEQACIQTAAWHRQGFNNLKLKVSVNLSVKQLKDNGFLESINQALNKSRLDPQFLDLELTETELLDENLFPLIKQLNQRKITFSIDDFGTGYSGFSYLKFFDIDRIKIDQSFIRDIIENNDSATIVSAILAMAKELNIKTLAEGVETYEQLEFLKKKGCNFAQGFFFSKAISSDDFERYLTVYADGISIDAIELMNSKTRRIK